MADKHWFGAQIFFKDGKLRDTAAELLRELYLENAGGQFGDDCWILPHGRVNIHAYRYVDWNGRHIMGHRFMYELFNGPIPKGYYVLHSCDNRPCCNPKHLRVGTAKENTADQIERYGTNGTNHYGERTHCPQGHEYTADNTYTFDGSRQCRTCSKGYKKRWADLNKARSLDAQRKRRQRRREAITANG